MSSFNKDRIEESDKFYYNPTKEDLEKLNIKNPEEHQNPSFFYDYSSDSIRVMSFSESNKTIYDEDFDGSDFDDYGDFGNLMSDFYDYVENIIEQRRKEEK